MVKGGLRMTTEHQEEIEGDKLIQVTKDQKRYL